MFWADHFTTTNKIVVYFWVELQGKICFISLNSWYSPKKKALSRNRHQLAAAHSLPDPTDQFHVRPTEGVRRVGNQI